MSIGRAFAFLQNPFAYDEGWRSVSRSDDLVFQAQTMLCYCICQFGCCSSHVTRSEILENNCFKVQALRIWVRKYEVYKTLDERPRLRPSITLSLATIKQAKLWAYVSPTARQPWCQSSTRCRFSRHQRWCPVAKHLDALSWRWRWRNLLQKQSCSWPRISCHLRVACGMKMILDEIQGCAASKQRLRDGKSTRWCDAVRGTWEQKGFLR